MKILRILTSTSLILAVFISWFGSLGAQTAPQSFASSGGVRAGSIVQLDEDNSGRVIPATQDQLDRVFGVVVDPGSFPLAIGNPDNENEVFVVTSGRYQALVTDENGPIKSGDMLTISSFSGAAMKSSTDQAYIVGRAMDNFDGSSGTSISSVPLRDINGRVLRSVSLGVVPINFELAQNPDVLSTEADLPPFLERVGLAIAEDPVDPFRIYLSLGIAVVSILVALVVLYSGVRSSIISIGRNPLSKRTIFRGLLEVILTSLLILIIGLFTVYLVLKL